MQESSLTLMHYLPRGAYSSNGALEPQRTAGHFQSKTSGHIPILHSKYVYIKMHINKYPGYVTKLSELKWFRTLKFGKDASDVTGVWRPQVRVGSEIVMSFVQVWELITPMLDLQSGVVKQHQSASMLLISRISFKQPSRDLKVTSFRSFIYRCYKCPQYANEIILERCSGNSYLPGPSPWMLHHSMSRMDFCRMPAQPVALCRWKRHKPGSFGNCHVF